jgi:hypothetical protein
MTLCVEWVYGVYVPPDSRDPCDLPRGGAKRSPKLGRSHGSREGVKSRFWVKGGGVMTFLYCLAKHEKGRERKREREIEREGTLEGKKSSFCLQGRNTNYILAGTKGFWWFFYYRCAYRDVIRFTSRYVKNCQFWGKSNKLCYRASPTVICWAMKEWYLSQ